MATFSLTGQDTAIIGGISLIDVADGDWFTLTFPNQLADCKTGKNGNSIYALNATGLNADASARVIRGSFTDKLLDSLLQEQLQVLPPQGRSMHLTTADASRRSPARRIACASNQ